MQLQNLLRGAAAIAVVSCAAVTAGAGVTPPPDLDVVRLESSTRLDDVLGKGFVVGNKLFRLTTWAGDFDASRVQVRAVQTGNETGFELGGFFIDAVDGAVSNASFSYDVWVLPEAYKAGTRINGAELGFNGAAGGARSYAEVEGFLDGPDEAVGSLRVRADGNLPKKEWTRKDNAAFDPLGHLRVENNIAFFASRGTAGRAALDPEDPFAAASVIRQTFTEIPAPGPLLAFGTAGAACLRRNRR